MVNEKDIKSVDLAYAAGIMDGDGCITIAKQLAPRDKRGYGYSLIVNLRNTDPKAANWLLEHFGGSVCHIPSKNPKWKRLYGWQVTSKKALSFLTQIKSHLILKKDRASIAVEFQSRRRIRKKGKTDHAFMLDESDYNQMKKLNKRGLH